MKTRAGQKAWWMVVSILTAASAPIGAQQWIVENGIDGPDPAFRAVWGSGPDGVFAVGERGAIWHYDGLSWSVMGSGTAQAISSIWGTGPNNIFAVGVGGIILHYDGSTWSAMVSPSNLRLCSVWGTGPNDIFAVGDAETILHYDGSSWSVVRYTSSLPLLGVSGTSPNDVFAVGDYGVILHYDGATWSKMTSPTTASLRSIWVADPNNIFVVGQSGTILRYNGSSWSMMTSGTTATLEGVWGTAPNNMLAVGDGGCVYHYDGTSWSPVSSGTTATLYGVWGSSTDNTYAVGYGGAIHRFDGSSWRTLNTPPAPPATTAALGDVWGSGPNDVFAVGGGAIVHYDGDQWSLMDKPDRTVVAISGSGPNDVYAVGAGGTVLHYDGSTWSLIDSGGTYNFVDVWCNGPNDLFVTDFSRVLRRYDGSNWVTFSGSYMRVFGFSTNEVFAVGYTSNGSSYRVTLYRFDGSAFVQVASMSTGPQYSLYGVGGSSPQDIYISCYFKIWTIGGYKVIRYDGSVFSDYAYSLRLGSIWASSPNDVWGTGTGGWGVVFHNGGGGWSTFDFGASSQQLQGMWGSGPNDVFAVGNGGAIAHYTPRTRYRLRAMVPNRPCGDVTVTPNRNYYEPNTAVTLTAQPTNGGTFVRWQGDVPTGHEQDNPLALQMDSDKMLTAIFRGPSLTLSVVHDTWGTVSVDPNQPFYRPGQWVTLTATPIEGKAFGGWTIYDPCFPGDAEHAIIDDNMVTSVQLNADTQVEAAFKCGSGLGMLPAPAALGLLVLLLLRRRR